MKIMSFYLLIIVFSYGVCIE